jgi:tetratricopeptide (TPR) repeat protein
MCRKAIVKAESLDSSVARASAYWNASVFEADRGSVSNAVPLAERALTLLSEGQDTRNLARLRNTLGRMQLDLNPPDVDEARRHLEKAAEELAWSSASPSELASNELARARADYLVGNLSSAAEACTSVLENIQDEPLIGAEASQLLGQVIAASGDMGGAMRAYRRAVFLLTGIGADRDAAQLWFELASLFEQAGDITASRDAYRSAAAASGLRPRAQTNAPAVVVQR